VGSVRIEKSNTMTNYHIPVMVREVLEGLHVVVGKQYIDATLGGGGHTTEILKAGGRVLALDADNDALKYAAERIRIELPDKREGVDWILVHGNFRDIADIAIKHEFTDVSGVLMDLGVSSYQLDTESKGFSYRFGGSNLDMRFDQTAGATAAEYINSASREELYEVFTKYGEEERARAIIDALIRARSVKHIETVNDVVAVVKCVVGDNKGTSGVLSRVFQALRIVTNDELHALSEGLLGARQILGHGGRLVVITFHSLEDRIVKQYLRGDGFGLLTKKPKIATNEERYRNVRSRSAKVRVAWKL
jgi:16S rRNA (cytosine1402-N4)-methyltransferase